MVAAEDGDACLDLNKTVVQLLGTKAAANLTDEEKNFTWRDMMRSNQARFDPPPGQNARIINDTQWNHIIDAIEKKTGSKYKGPGAASCCCTL